MVKTKTSFGYITKKQYKKVWNVNLKKPYVVIKEIKRKKASTKFIPQKTFNTVKQAKTYIHKKTK